MCLRFVFLLATRLAAWLRLSRREETWKTAEILILRHQVAVLQRLHPRRPMLTWADRALLAALLGVIPKGRRHGLRLLVTPDTILRWHRHIVRRRRAARSTRARPAGRPPARTSGPWSSGWPATTPNGGTAGSTGSWPAWECESRRRPYGRSSRTPESTRASADRADLVAVPALPGRRDPGLRLLHGGIARPHPGLCAGRDRARDPAHPHPRRHAVPDRGVDDAAGPQPAHGPRRTGGPEEG